MDAPSLSNLGQLDMPLQLSRVKMLFTKLKVEICHYNFSITLHMLISLLENNSSTNSCISMCISVLTMLTMCPILTALLEHTISSECQKTKKFKFWPKKDQLNMSIAGLLTPTCWIDGLVVHSS
jgi:hypothetical protein